MSDFESMPPSVRVSPPAPPVRRSRFTVPPERRVDVLASGLVLAGGGAAYAIPEPVQRAGALLICGAVLYLMGLFQRKPGT